MHSNTRLSWVAGAALGLTAADCASPPADSEHVGTVGSPSPAMPASGGVDANDTTGSTTKSDTAGKAPGLPAEPEAANAECIPAPSCDATLPPAPAPRGFRNVASSVVALLSSSAAGHDTLIAAGAPQTLIGRFVYGAAVALEDEDVDVYVQRGCAGEWTAIGTARTTSGEHAAVDGVADDGGRVFFDIPAEERLAIGRHRVMMVARGDGNQLDFVVDVLPASASTSLAISDVDGTLTVAEDAEIGALLTGSLPAARPDAAQVLSTLATKGYRIAYVTARPEWLMERTRAFLHDSGFPRGVVRTATGTVLPHKGPDAVTYKTAQLGLLGAVAKPHWLFGNTVTDAEAYGTYAGTAMIGVPPSHRVFVEYSDAAHGGRTVGSWTQLLAETAALPSVCQAR